MPNETFFNHLKIECKASHDTQDISTILAPQRFRISFVTP